MHSFPPVVGLAPDSAASSLPTGSGYPGSPIGSPRGSGVGRSILHPLDRPTGGVLLGKIGADNGGELVTSRGSRTNFSTDDLLPRGLSTHQAPCSTAPSSRTNRVAAQVAKGSLPKPRLDAGVLLFVMYPAHQEPSSIVFSSLGSIPSLSSIRRIRLP
jgi:hypothetical protein